MADMRVDECEVWPGYVRPDGYGVVRIKGDDVPRYAHRWVYEDAFGPIPEGMEVHHLCRNEACVNLAHLALFSRHDHASFHFTQPRRPRRVCPHGHPYTPENTGTRSDGYRYCRICKRAKNRRDNAKRKKNRIHV